MKLYAATKNAGKLKEIRAILSEVGIEAEGFPDLPEIEETGTTFEENAAIKAEFLSKLTSEYVIADDSGIAVDALGGKPGVYSARYAGNHGDDEANNNKLLKDMKGVKNRKCKFICVIALAKNGRRLALFRGQVKGTLAETPSGSGGFGYDPLFITDNGISMAGLSTEEKNAISHRRKALEALKDFFLKGEK